MLLHLTATVHILTGVAYILGVGVLTTIDLVMIYRETGRIAWFGVALISMAASCGPHHLEHGLHQAVGYTDASWADFWSVLIALPPAVGWFLLQLEGALRSDGGDRRFAGSRRAVQAAPWVYALVVSLCLAVPLAEWWRTGSPHLPNLWPQLALTVEYLVIGYFLLTAQWDHYGEREMWSLSGLMFAAIFPTCALSHLVYGIEVAQGNYAVDSHLTATDTFGVVAAVWFILVVAQGRRRLREKEST